jgi:hypothetical protein
MLRNDVYLLAILSSITMSFLDNLTSLATGALSGDTSAIVKKVEAAIKAGVSPQSPVAQEIVVLVKKQFPQLQGKANIVQAIDDLIPDSLQSKFGFTPPVMNFIKQALGSTPAQPQ